MTSLQDVNPSVRAIRAPVSLQGLAARIADQIRQGANKPFKTVIDVSASDPQREGMAPVTFVRQVLAACIYPKLLEEESLPLAVRQRAQMLLTVCGGGSVGSYSTTDNGIPHVHESIAEFIERRDGVRSDPENIIFSTGLEKALWMVFHLMSSGEGQTRAGMLTPTPCPHTLLNLLDVTGLKVVPYKLTEDQGWALDMDVLHSALETAKAHCMPRAIFISNPGNPTGHVQDRKTIEDVIHFAASKGLVLIVEEVFQDTVHGQDKEFISYKKVLSQMGHEYSETVEMISFNAISGPHMSECGMRGAYMEAINLDPRVKKYLLSLQAPCSPAVLPQLAMEVMVNPPTPGDPFYETYEKEIIHMQMTLSKNAQHAFEFLNHLPGMSCQPAMAGVFLYPRLDLPSQMIEEAKMLGVEADILYCQRLLEEEGLCLGAGCENGQEDQHYHIRLSVLVPPATLEDLLARLRSFHLRLLNRFIRDGNERLERCKEVNALRKSINFKEKL